MPKRLSEMEFGTTGTVMEIRASSRQINALGIRVGKELRMITKQPIRGPVVVTVREVGVAMGLELASEIIMDVRSE